MPLTREQLTAVSARLKELIAKAQNLRDGINRQLVRTSPQTKGRRPVRKTR